LRGGRERAEERGCTPRRRSGTPFRERGGGRRSRTGSASAKLDDRANRRSRGTFSPFLLLPSPFPFRRGKPMTGGRDRGRGAVLSALSVPRSARNGIGTDVRIAAAGLPRKLGSLPISPLTSALPLFFFFLASRVPLPHAGASLGAGGCFSLACSGTPG